MGSNPIPAAETGERPQNPDRLEAEREAEWLWRTVRERPKPFAMCGDMEDAVAKRLARSARQLRGTGELRALNQLVNRLLETATAQA